MKAWISHPTGFRPEKRLVAGAATASVHNLQMPGNVAAAWKYHGGNGKVKELIQQQATKLLSYKNVGTRITQVDGILRRKAEHALFKTEGQIFPESQEHEASAKETERKEKIVRELLKKAKRRRKLVRSYSYFTWFCAFFGCFLGNLYIKEQQNEHLSSVDYSIKNRIVDILPTGSVGDNMQFYLWLEQVVMDVFEDPICGDGICEGPMEYAGFGRFGCVSDCGRFSQSTTIIIDLRPVWFTGMRRFDLSGFNAALRDSPAAQFSYNIYSETMGTYIFEQDCTQPSITVDVPDGDLRLELYQTGMLRPDIVDTDFAVYASTAPYTVMKSSKDFDFQYGEPAEAIATVASLNRQLMAYCSSNVNISTACGRNYDVQSMAAELRTKYGLAGNISVINGTKLSTLVSIPFCTLTPPDVADAARLDSSFCGFPSTSARTECFDGAVLAQNFQCTSQYSFSIWSYGPPRNVTVRPVPMPRSRILTPFNNVIGGIIISQYTRQLIKCPQENSESIRILTGQYACEMEEVAVSPFGTDPTFQRTSMLYNGKLRMRDYYADNELADVNSNAQNSRVYPYAFYPHQWDAGGIKNQSLISPESYGVYKIFLDARLTARNAMRMLQFMRDAQFVTNKTNWIELEIITYNADFNLFGILTVQFRWNQGGSILWDYQYNTALISPYEGIKGQISLSLDLIFGLMLLADIIRECRDIYFAVLRENVFRGYVMKFWNWVEWTQYGLLTACFGCWTLYNQYISSIQFKPEYPVLKDVFSSGRPLATDPQNEFELLDFTIKMRKLSELKNFWTALSCVTILLFVMRFLKLLDFQPRMSLITRTLKNASVDLGHYLTLFTIIFVGYATIATILLGDRLSQFQSFSDACTSLFMLLMAWEPETMYRTMNKATSMANIQATKVTFQIFFWTFVLIATFLMLNIVLAIIVDAFSAIKSNLKDAPTITEESWSICRQSARMLGNRLYGKEWFISDKEFEKELLIHERSFQSRQKIMRSVGQIRSSNIKVVRLPGGLKVSDRDLENLLAGSSCMTRRSLLTRAKALFRKPPIPQRQNRRASIYVTSQKEDGIEIAEDNAYRPPAPIWDLINRYGEVISEGQDDQELLEYLEAENMKREMALYATQLQIKEDVGLVKDTIDTLVNHVLPSEEMEKLAAAKATAQKKKAEMGMQSNASKPTYFFQGTLQATMVSAKRLPKLDLFSESDPYCVLLVEEENLQTVLACTEPVSNDPNPIWNTDHTCPFKCMADTHLVLAVLDRNEHGTDEIIGAIKIDVSDLPVNQDMDRWYRLRNDSNPTLTKKALLRVKLKLIPESSGPAPVLRRNSLEKGATTPQPGVPHRLLHRAAELEEELRWLNDELMFASGEPGVAASAVLEVTIISARHLPRRRTLFSKLSLFDPYVRLSFEGVEYDSVVRKNTYCPDWGQSFAFQMEEGTRPSTPLVAIIIDWNKYTDHEVLGTVEVSQEELDEIMREAWEGGMEERSFDIHKKGQPLLGHDGMPSQLSMAFRVDIRSGGFAVRRPNYGGYGDSDDEEDEYDGDARADSPMRHLVPPVLEAATDLNYDGDTVHSDGGYGLSGGAGSGRMSGVGSDDDNNNSLGPPVHTDFNTLRSLAPLHANRFARGPSPGIEGGSGKLMGDVLRRHCRPPLPNSSEGKAVDFRVRQRARIAMQLAADFGVEGSQEDLEHRRG